MKYPWTSNPLNELLKKITSAKSVGNNSRLVVWEQLV